jgi:ABC-2 type transport system ATP-binding protein
MLLPDAGKVLVEGADTLREPAQVRKKVGFAVASERSFFPRLTARENLDFFATLEDVPRETRAERAAWALQTTGLTEAADTLVMKFSTGMFQRLGIARALVKKPSILILDEPTRSIDPAAALQGWNFLRNTAALGTTVLLATHNFDEAVAVGDSVALLRRGVLVNCHRLGRGTTVEELRSSYFREVESISEAADLLPWGVS